MYIENEIWWLEGPSFPLSSPVAKLGTLVQSCSIFHLKIASTHQTNENHKKQVLDSEGERAKTSHLNKFKNDCFSGEMECSIFGQLCDSVCQHVEPFILNHISLSF